MSSTTLPPGPPYPRAVTTLGWILRPGPFMERCRDRYGDSFSLQIANEGTWVFLSHPDAVKEVFTGDPALLRAGEANGVLGPVVGSNSVLLLDEPQHMVARKIMLPPFHGERMQRYGEVIGEVADREIASWPVGEPLAVAPHMQALTLEVIMRAVFGIEDAARLEELRARLTSLLDWTTRPSRLIRLAAVGPGGMSRLRELRSALAPVHAILLAEIARRREDPEAAGGEDILSLLVQARYEDGRPMSDEELRDELMTLLVAGHETTATALSWAVERLVRHPEVLERLTEEVRAGGEEYLDAVAKETLRLRPVLPIVLRRLAAPMEIGGWSLPAGVRVAPCIYLMHRREDIYPEPRRFRPERFLERPAGTYTWIPFGGGVRRCLGASFALFEMKAVLGALVRAARLEPAAAPGERIRRRAITMAPSRGGEVVVAERLVPAAPASAPVEVAA